MTTPSLSWIDRSRWSTLLENATPAPGPVAGARPPRTPAKTPSAAAAKAPIPPRKPAPTAPVAPMPAAPAARPAPVVQFAAAMPVTPAADPLPAIPVGETPPSPIAVAVPPHADYSPTTTRAGQAATPLPPPVAEVIDTRAEAGPGPTSAPVPPSQVLPLAFEPPHAELEERLQAFFEWVIRSVPCTAAFIADEHGLPLIQRGAMPDHIAFSSSVLTLLESLEGLPKRWLSIGIARETILHLAEVSTVWGRFGVGIVATDSLRRDVLAIVQQGLERAFEE